MANEAVLVYELSPPIPMTCANSTGIERGCSLTLSDPMTAAKTTSSAAACAGICAEEKIASDGKTKVPVYQDGIFKVTASGAVVVGEAVVFNEDNTCSAQGATQVFKAGYSYETAADTETFFMKLQPSHRVIA